MMRVLLLLTSMIPAITKAFLTLHYTLGGRFPFRCAPSPVGYGHGHGRNAPLFINRMKINNGTDDEDEIAKEEKLAKVLYGVLDEEGETALLSSRNETEQQWQLTACLRQRNEWARKDTKRLRLENDRLEDSRALAVRKKQMVGLANHSFVHYISGGNLSAIHMDSDGIHSDALKALLQSQSDGPGLFNEALHRYGLSYPFVANRNTSLSKLDNNTTTTLRLDVIETQERADSILASKILSGFAMERGDKDTEGHQTITQNENEYLGQIQVSKDALSWRKQLDREIEALEEVAEDAEQQIYSNNWHIAYIRLAKHCFIQAYIEGTFVQIDVSSFPDIAAIYEEYEKNGHTEGPHCSLFQETLKLHGLFLRKIESKYYKDLYYFTFGYRSDEFEGAELLDKS